MPQLWVIRAWVAPVGRFADEYAAQGPDTRATFDQRLRFLAFSPMADWRPPASKKLKGECDPLVEIRFKADSVQQRPLGFFGVSRMTFTLLFWATEKNDRFVPRDACAIANRRRVEVEKDENKFSRVWNVE